jgi:hypothetical protein
MFVHALITAVVTGFCVYDLLTIAARYFHKG